MTTDEMESGHADRIDPETDEFTSCVHRDDHAVMSTTRDAVSHVQYSFN